MRGAGEHRATTRRHGAQETNLRLPGSGGFGGDVAVYTLASYVDGMMLFWAPRQVTWDVFVTVYELLHDRVYSFV